MSLKEHFEEDFLEDVGVQVGGVEADEPLDGEEDEFEVDGVELGDDGGDEPGEVELEEMEVSKDGLHVGVVVDGHVHLHESHVDPECLAIEGEGQLHRPRRT